MSNTNQKIDPSTALGLPAFSAWFGQSSVVDSQGAPLVVYHGTRSPWRMMLDAQQRLQVFDQKTAGMPRDLVAANRAFLERSQAAVWFTDWESVAAGYSDQYEAAEERCVLSGFLSLQNALDLRLQARSCEDIYSVLQSAYSGFANPRMSDFTSEISEMLCHGIIADCIAWDSSRLISHARSLGHDGLIYWDTDIRGKLNHVSYVAFCPGQFKSDSNSGAFDRHCADIHQ